jgi:acyl-CoA dehydrogenase
MAYDEKQGRADLLAFEAEQPQNFWRADPHLQRVVRRWGGEQAAAWEAELDALGALAAGPLDRAVRENNLAANLPRLERFGPYGERLEAVAHHPTYHEAGRIIYGSGVMSVLGQPGQNLRSLALFFLTSLDGEAGHNCPLACTAGVIKTVLHLGTPELKERWLPRLLSRDYDQLAHGAQFLTEVQGGSDVGANAVTAEPGDTPGTWSLHGEKWFCSNVTADLILMTARVPGGEAGTRGLGLFLVPRRLADGQLNAFTIRRLKDKLGTRSMASGEMDFHGAFAWNLGPVEDGFRSMMTHVITTSRIFNAVGTSANARRACLVAGGYARRRRAFGTSIGRYPLVQETLADMEAETAAMTSGSFHLLHLLDRAERGEASAEEQGFLRMAVNLNKMRSAQSAHEVVLSGIEVLGGNGAIETFSVLPRLLRDNVVFENWEGTHNVLLVQVLRDAARLKVHEPYFAILAHLGGEGRIGAAVRAARAELESVLAAPEAEATLRMRPLGARLAFLQWAAALRADGTPAPVLDHFLDRRLGPEASRDARYLARIAALART